MSQSASTGYSSNYSLQDFDFVKTVGTGSFGRVRVVRMRDGSNTVFALKSMKKDHVIKLKQVEHVKSERGLLATLDHPFIVNLVGAFQDRVNLYMVMEFVNGGELFTIVRNAKKLSNEQSRFYAAEVTLAFEYLHSLYIAYRDLKPENLLLDCEGHIKVTDFGFAKVIQDRTWTVVGTPEYIAPEVIQSKGHGMPIDWWSMGILIFEMLAGYPPFVADSPMDIYAKVIKGKCSFPPHFDPNAKDLIKLLLNPDKSRRIGCLDVGAEDIKRHAWNSGISWSQMLRRNVEPSYVPRVQGQDDTSAFEDYPESRDQPGGGSGKVNDPQFEGF